MSLLSQQVLSQAVERAIGGGRVRTAAFITYQFDPAFFEHSVLPLLFARGFTEGENVRRAQLDEALQELDHIAVYYDRHGLITERGPARLDYQRVGVSMRSGVLHAKHVLLLIEDAHEDHTTERLVVVTTSANLTRSGWWENAEVAHVHTINEGDADSLRNDLLSKGAALGLLRAVQRLDRTDNEHPALDAIDTFLKTKTFPTKAARRKGLFRPRLYVGRQPFADFLTKDVELNTEGCRLEIISPFFSDTVDAKLVHHLLATLRPSQTRIHLPRNDAGDVLCAKPFYEAVSAIPNVTWGHLPGELTRLGKKDKAGHRYVHAKIYRLFRPQERWEVIVAGSVNLTDPAHAGAFSGNLESAVFLDLEPPKKPDWWMAPNEDLSHADFKPQRAEDDPEPFDQAILPLSFRFNWQTSELTYFWEDPEKLPAEARCAIAGVERFTITPVIANAWVRLADDHAQEVRKSLRTNSFIDVTVPDHPPVRILVREEAMAHKPSVLEDLGPEEILEYWALLTAEQRDAFLETKFAQLLAKLEDGTGNARLRVAYEEPASMFDRFAGIFHAFSCLEERIDEALEEETPRGIKQAEYRLFGNKHDSLGALLTKLLEEDADADPVNRYLSLLCARELVRRLRRKHPDFFKAHRAAHLELKDRLKQGNKLRKAFTFGTRSERAAFLDWIEKMFRTKVRVPEEAEA